MRTRDEGWLDGVTVVVGTPEAFALAIEEDAIELDCVDQLIIDECDVCFRPEPDCSALWKAATSSPRRWQTVAVGATVSDETLAFARSFGLLNDPWMVQLGDPQKLPPAMKHRAVVVVSPRGSEAPHCFGCAFAARRSVLRSWLLAPCSTKAQGSASAPGDSRLKLRMPSSLLLRSGAAPGRGDSVPETRPCGALPSHPQRPARVRAQK